MARRTDLAEVLAEVLADTAEKPAEVVSTDAPRCPKCGCLGAADMWNGCVDIMLDDCPGAELGMAPGEMEKWQAVGEQALLASTGRKPN